MTKISMTTDIDASADEVWKLIGGFNALPDWHPAIEKSQLEEEGQQRRLSVAGGGTIIERLEKIDDDSRTYSYTITDSPLPLANYKSTIKVTGEGAGCSVEWSSEFVADGGSEGDAMEAVRGIYQAGFDNLQKMFGGK
jgi:hypothetical protein